MRGALKGWLVLAVLLGTMVHVFAQDEVVLTTYYPSPRGVYNELRVGSSTFPSPNAKLHVVQPADDGTLAFRVDDDSPTDDTPFVITEEGNVGIGTTGPAGKVHVFTDIDITANPNTKGIRLDENPAQWLLSLGVATVSNSYFAIRDVDAGAYRFVINDTGNIGIGTTAPGETLEVNGNVRLSGSTPTYKITNIASPTDNPDVATKEYVDAQTGGAIEKICGWITSGQPPAVGSCAPAGCSGSYPTDLGGGCAVMSLANPSTGDREGHWYSLPGTGYDGGAGGYCKRICAP